MAVGLGLPSLVNVVSRMYSDLANVGKGPLAWHQNLPVPGR